MRSAALLVASLIAAASAACAATSSPQPVCASNAPCAAKTSVTSAESDPPPIAKVWASRCGSCHVRVEPGTRDRATLETALKRHRTRVKMDEAQWGSLVDFLAAR